MVGNSVVSPSDFRWLSLRNNDRNCAFFSSSIFPPACPPTRTTTTMTTTTMTTYLQRILSFPLLLFLSFPPACSSVTTTTTTTTTMTMTTYPQRILSRPRLATPFPPTCRQCRCDLSLACRRRTPGVDPPGSWQRDTPPSLRTAGSWHNKITHRESFSKATCNVM